MTQADMHSPQTLAGGRYLLVEPIGEGGMATVYRGFDQRLQVWRAIKVLNPKFASSRKVKARFDTEAQTMALLEHPNIVRVYDVGSIGKISYIVMELVEGGTPVDWLERHGAMPPQLALQVTEQLCHGIEAAHAKGVIHRDIKPHNLLMTLDGTCRVTDFGIARVGDGDRSMTKTGAVMGTWGYMAPEQRSDAKTVDERGDVYAIAATLYTLITNRIPMDLFAADRDKSVMNGVPEALYQVMIKATDYDKDGRYPSVAALRQALLQAAAELPDDPPDTPPLIHRRPDRRDPPSPEVLARATPLVNEATGQVAAPTLLPNSSVDGTAADQTRSGGTPVPVGTPVGVPAAATSPSFDSEPAPRRKRGALAWFLAAVPLILGLLLLVVAGAISVPLLMGESDASADGDSGLQADVDADSTGADADGTADGLADDTDADSATTDVEPDSQAAVKDPTPTVVSDPTPQGTPDPDPDSDPDPDTQAATDPDTDPADGSAEPDATTTPEGEQGTADPDEGGDPVDVSVAVQPEKEQCVQATPPASATVGSQARFSANLCVEEGDPRVTLYYRPAGTGSWQSVGMPKRLGAYRTVVQIDERFSGGLEFYIETDGAAYGSRSGPKRVSVR